MSGHAHERAAGQSGSLDPLYQIGGSRSDSVGAKAAHVVISPTFANMSGNCRPRDRLNAGQVNGEGELPPKLIAYEIIAAACRRMYRQGGA
jgi:hypothetical protein